ncbi:E3 ubiquitin-protein ligase hel2 like [Verticillium longisporum]|nr:E3 ubiquitin-protein ligase hel2 like [Verticillium longisporum]
MASTEAGAADSTASRGGQRNRGRGRSEGGASRGSNNTSRGRGQRTRGRGGGTHNRGENQLKPSSTTAQSTQDVTPPTQGNAPPPTSDGKAAEGAPSTSDGDEVCFICADPIKFHSIAPCNHKTCHICGLRMRALYKTTDCPHCRTAAPFVIFTEDPLKRTPAKRLLAIR